MHHNDQYQINQHIYINYIFTHIFQVLYSTIQHQQEAVIITDALIQIQYANKAVERLLHTKIVRDSLQYIYIMK